MEEVYSVVAAVCWCFSEVVEEEADDRCCSPCCQLHDVVLVGAATRILESNGDWGDQHQPNEAHAHKSGDETKRNGRISRYPVWWW
jgi:hypothetical protein